LALGKNSFLARSCVAKAIDISEVTALLEKTFSTRENSEKTPNGKNLVIPANAGIQ
jgi:hypothetical protein